MTYESTVYDIEFEKLYTYWIEEYSFAPDVARWLSLYQYTGGNAFALTDINYKINYAPRPEC